MRALARRRATRAQAGFTLVELMISLVLFSFVIAGVLAVAVSMAAGFREQKVAMGAEGAARQVMDFLVDAVRGASPVGAVTVANDNAGPDRLRIVFAYGSVVTSSSSLLTTGSTTLDVVNSVGFAIGDQALVTDFVTGHIATVTSVTATQLGVIAPGSACTTNLAVNYVAGASVIRVARAEFSVADLDGVPTLWMDPDADGLAAAPQPMAEGIEDLQVMLGIDGNADGLLAEDTSGPGLDEWTYNVSGEAVVPAGTLRALRISLIARATGKVTGIGTFLAPPIGDRPGGSTPDNYRRRALTSTVDIRNIQDSR
jgi:prepilin-type N-terminal cleavage/methylation domain-containing protein